MSDTLSFTTKETKLYRGMADQYLHVIFTNGNSTRTADWQLISETDAIGTVTGISAENQERPRLTVTAPHTGDQCTIKHVPTCITHIVQLEIPLVQTNTPPSRIHNKRLRS